MSQSQYFKEMLAIEKEKLSVQKEVLDLKRHYYEKKLELMARDTSHNTYIDAMAQAFK